MEANVSRALAVSVIFIASLYSNVVKEFSVVLTCLRTRLKHVRFLVMSLYAKRGINCVINLFVQYITLFWFVVLFVEFLMVCHRFSEFCTRLIWLTIFIYH